MHLHSCLVWHAKCSLVCIFWDWYSDNLPGVFLYFELKFTVHKEVHEEEHNWEILGVQVQVGSYLGKYLHLCTTAQSHHILPCDSTLMTPNEVKTNSMMAALMVPYWNLTNKSFISWPTQAASQVLSLEELLPLQGLTCHSQVSFVCQAKSDFCCLWAHSLVCRVYGPYLRQLKESRVNSPCMLDTQLFNL